MSYANYKYQKSKILASYIFSFISEFMYYKKIETKKKENMNEKYLKLTIDMVGNSNRLSYWAFQTPGNTGAFKPYELLGFCKSSVSCTILEVVKTLGNLLTMLAHPQE